MSILTDASLIITPNAVKSGSLLAVVPSNGNGDLTWTRNSGATRVNSAGLIENVLANVPRLDYSLGGCPSILLEPQRTNLFFRSEEFDNSAWNKLASSVTANTAISPSGLMNAYSFIGDGSLSFHSIQQVGTFVINTAYTISVYVKKNTNDFIQLIAPSPNFGVNAYANFNINTGILGTIGSSATATITSMGNGWYRCTITATATSSGSSVFSISLITSATSLRTEQNTLSTSVFLWGAQLEQGAYPTSYIPTTSASVTRVADVATPKVVTPTMGGTIINSNFYQKYTGQTPSIVDLRSDFDLFAITPTAQDVLNKTEAVFLIDIKADIPFTIIIQGVGTIHWGDGTTTAYNSPSSDVAINKTFLKNNGIVAFVGTLTKLSISTANVNTAHRLEDLPSVMTVYSNAGQNTTSGNIASLPSVMTVYANLGQNTTSGNIASLPSVMTYYRNIGLNQVNQYTAGRVWANNMNLVEHRPAVGFGLTSTMVDNLLIDLANVPTWVSNKRITLTGNNAPRTAASNAAVATLVSKGVTVQTN